MDIPNCFYRVSIKALVLNEERDKFLITQEHNGQWELPGGGLDWGFSPHEDLPREIQEEMGLEVEWIADHPSYFLAIERDYKDFHLVNVLYETKLKGLDFTPSDECIDIKFVNAAEAATLNAFSNVLRFAEVFDPKRHQ